MAKILVIDDDPMMLELDREILARVGHDVVIAENGAQGLARTDRQPEPIVVDLMIPKMSGYDFVKQLRATEVCGDAGDRGVGSFDRPMGAARWG